MVYQTTNDVHFTALDIFENILWLWWQIDDIILTEHRMVRFLAPADLSNQTAFLNTV